MSTHLPVVDVHAHPFLNQGAVTAEEFTDLTAFGGGSRAYMEAGRRRVHDGGARRTAAGQARHPLLQAHGPRPGPLLRTSSRTSRRCSRRAMRPSRPATRDYVAQALRRRRARHGRLRLRHAAADARCRRRCSAELPVEVVPIFRIEPLIADLLKTGSRLVRVQAALRRHDRRCVDQPGLSRASNRSSPIGPDSTSRRSAARRIRDSRRSTRSGAVSAAAV